MKKTQAIKERLNAHREMLEKLKALREELEYAIEAFGSVGAIDYSGMPKGGGDGTSKTERIVFRKIAIEEKIAKKEKEIADDWAELEPLIERLAPSETLILNLRYCYGADWKAINRRIYGRAKDFDLDEDLYMKRVFKSHGRALLALADMMAAAQ